MWTDYALPPLAALLLWWLGTGVVLLLNRVPAACGNRQTVARVAASCAAIAALLGISESAPDRSVGAAYLAFFCAVVLWGWHELAFVTGWITGPRKAPASTGLRGWPRLVQAVQVLLWHELALLANALALWWWQAGSANPTAAWTFTLLYAMRVSAKLNLFLGVRNLSLDFLPPQMSYLGSYFRQRAGNRLLPLSLAAGLVVTGVLLHAAQSTTEGVQAAHLLLASLLTLALVEHLMMVLPLQPSFLWRWALGRPVQA